MQKTVLAALVGAALTFAGCGLAPAASAEPALWVVKDEDSTLYLFGTVHALKPTAQWRTPKVAAAMAEADDLWLEIVDADNAAALQPLIIQLGVDRARPLSSKLTEKDRAELAEAAAKVGMSAQQLEPMRPWLAAVTLGVAPLIAAGYDPSKGVDNLLKAEAVAAQKPVKAFETAEQQFRFFADLPEAVQVEMLRETLDDVEGATEIMNELATAWEKGDLKRLEKAFVDEMKDSPEVYKVLIVDRNADWTTQIRRILAGKGESFIAVGAGHLVGPDSVQAMLKSQGVTVERK